jgi:ligand-binding sensor domain-containing protein
MQKLLLPLNTLIILFLLTTLGCQLDNKTVKQVINGVQPYADSSFWQEYHDGYPVTTNTPGSNEVRSIVADAQSNIWIATTGGIFVKKANESTWTTPFQEADQGPSFDVVLGDSSTVWLSNWKGVYTYKNGGLKLMSGVTAPISALCLSKEGLYALGPKGVWLFDKKGCRKKEYPIARSVRNAISDNRGGLWIATDVGIYHTTPTGTKHIFSTDHLISAYIKFLPFM